MGKTSFSPCAAPAAERSRRAPRALALVLTLAALGVCLVLLGTALRLPAGKGADHNSGGSGPGLAIAQCFSRAKSAALNGLVYIKKVYMLPEDTVVAPEPNPDAFGETTDSAEVARVVADAAELLDGQQMIWNEDIKIRRTTTMHYYRDETILGVTWQEIVSGRMCTFCEVKVADASQFRRKLAEDAYGSTIQEYPKELAAECNAVMATSADFYRYQKQGVNVYQRQLYRWDGCNMMDTCFVDGKGDLLFVRAGELADKAAIERYIADNNVLFSLCFGPVVIENGVNVTPSRAADYPMGEYADAYPRAILAQIDELHYLFAVFFNYLPLTQAADILVAKGVTHAYAVDGGQSGTVVVDDEHVSPYQYGHARTQSDILYFATALPNDRAG